MFYTTGFSTPEPSVKSQSRVVLYEQKFARSKRRKNMLMKQFWCNQTLVRCTKNATGTYAVVQLYNGLFVLPATEAADVAQVVGAAENGINTLFISLDLVSRFK